MYHDEFPDPVHEFEIPDLVLAVKIDLDVGSSYDRLIASVQWLHQPLEVRKPEEQTRIALFHHEWMYFFHDTQWTYEVDLEPYEALCWFAYANIVPFGTKPIEAFNRNRDLPVWKEMQSKMEEYVQVHKLITS